MRAICLLVVLAAGAAAADPKPDYTFTAEAFAKESRANPRAFQTKYKGKVVELTGVLREVQVPGFILELEGDPGVKGKTAHIHAAAKVRKESWDKVRPLSRRQQVTIRGRQYDSSVPLLMDCEVVKAGPSPAVGVTVAGLVAEWKADRNAAGKKYRDQPVVARLKVLTAQTQGITVVLDVTDPGAKDGPTAHVALHGGSDDEFLKGLQKVKAGDEIVVICPSGGPEAKPLFMNAVLLKEPPEGVKLPGDKK